jgi:exopolysaccharide biosynthesis protein
MRKNHHVFRRAFLCALTVFSVYVLLDTFVIVRRIETSAEARTDSEPAGYTQTGQAAVTSRLSAAAEATPDPEPVRTEDTYRDENIRVTVTEERVGSTSGYLADVELSSAEYLKTAFAENTYGRNVTDKTSSIAESVNAILAVNGDFYGSRQSGYVIRGGTLYRSAENSEAEDLVIYGDGSFEIIRESEVSAGDLVAGGARDVLSFGPALIENGEIAVTPDDEVGRAKASNPRTAIAVIDDLHYLFVVSDGRTAESEGLSLYELAAFLRSRGVRTAYNLDGGGSSTMVFNGRVVNNPTSGGKGTKERSVSDIVYIG